MLHSGHPSIFPPLFDVVSLHEGLTDSGGGQGLHRDSLLLRHLLEDGPAVDVDPVQDLAYEVAHLAPIPCGHHLSTLPSTKDQLNSYNEQLNSSANN